jgi:hypothetical protein
VTLSRDGDAPKSPAKLRPDAASYRIATFCRAQRVGLHWRNRTQRVRPDSSAVLRCTASGAGGTHRMSAPISVSRRFGMLADRRVAFLGILRPHMIPGFLCVRDCAVNALTLSPSLSVGTYPFSRRMLYAGIGRWKPLRESSPAGSASTRSSTVPRKRRATRIWPALASPQRRAARLVTVPMAP